MSKITVCSIIFALAVPAVLAACSSPGPKSEDAPLVEDKYRLSADRQAFDEIRGQVPAEKKIQNDEMAFVLQKMDGHTSPTAVREAFNSAMSKKRDVFQKDLTKKREAYVKDEKVRREEFLRGLERERNDFKGKKADSETRRRFFDDIDARRRDFFAGEREKRDDFEAQIRDQRKNFDDYLRERRDEFNAEHRAYQKRYDEEQKAKAQQPTQ